MHGDILVKTHLDITFLNYFNCALIPMLLVANLANSMMQNSVKMTQTLANGYSSESTQQELSNEYQHDRV